MGGGGRRKAGPRVGGERKRHLAIVHANKICTSFSTHRKRKKKSLDGAAETAVLDHSECFFSPVSVYLSLSPAGRHTLMINPVRAIHHIGYIVYNDGEL